MSDHSIIYVSFYQLPFVFINSILKITECFTNIFFKTILSDFFILIYNIFYYKLFFILIIHYILIGYEELETVLIQRLFKFFRWCFLVELSLIKFRATHSKSSKVKTYDYFYYGVIKNAYGSFYLWICDDLKIIVCYYLFVKYSRKVRFS